MTTSRIKFLIGAALVGGTMTIAAGAQAYWGAPWGGPWSEPGWGGGPWTEPGHPYSGYGPALDRTHARQREMRDHRAAMRSVARMLSGQRRFDRAKAIGLAREARHAVERVPLLRELRSPGDAPAHSAGRRHPSSSPRAPCPGAAALPGRSQSG